MKRLSFAAMAAVLCGTASAASGENVDLWHLYENVLKRAKYIDLTHAFEPVQAVWPGFGHARFKPARVGNDSPGYVQRGEVYTYADHGFVARAYDLPADQYGTQLDPPAHWNPLGATISDLPATYAIRPLVVIDLHDKVARNPGYHMTVADIADWERDHGRVPEGSVVMMRSD